MFDRVRWVVAQALENAAEEVQPEPKVLPWPWGLGFVTTALAGIAIGLTRSRVERVAQDVVALRESANEALGATRKRVDEMERMGAATQNQLNALVRSAHGVPADARVVDHHAAEHGTVSGADAPVDLDRLRDFLEHRYPDHQFVGNPIDVAIGLLTPGDGSDEAWRWMRVARGQEGAEAQRALVASVAAAAKSPEVELGQCRASPAGVVVRIDAQAPDGKFLATIIIGRASEGADARDQFRDLWGWPKSSEDIRSAFPIVLLGKVAPVSAAMGANGA